MKDLADAIKDIIIMYDKACKVKYVKFPLGYALYHTWKKYQHIWEIAEDAEKQLKEQKNE